MRVGSVVDEWDAIPLSSLSQAGYCLRRAALLINERLWNENADTARGKEEHRRVHDHRIEKRGDLVYLYEYEVFSERLGIGGKCDCIEATQSEDGCIIPAVDFSVKLYPVEYKHGKLRDEEEYEIQLCAQAICLEDMYHTQIREGAIFYISSHRRQPIAFTTELREKTIHTIQVLDEIRKKFKVPKAQFGPKCNRCSLHDLCMPNVSASAKDYCEKLTHEATEVDVL